MSKTEHYVLNICNSRSLNQCYMLYIFTTYRNGQNIYIRHNTILYTFILVHNNAVFIIQNNLNKITQHCTLHALYLEINTILVNYEILFSVLLH